ncbi:hypothetical protein, partial [Actinoplanes flavus]
YLAAKGFDPVLGARPLRRTIQRELEDTLSEQILFNELRPGQIAMVDCHDDRAGLVFHSAAPIESVGEELLPG